MFTGKTALRLMFAGFLVAMFLSGCVWEGSSDEGPVAVIVVNSLEDAVYPATAGTVTIRDAIGRAEPGEKITFDPALDGGTIDLTIVGEEHSILKGEVFAPGFLGYEERDFGASALYAARDITIDASGLPNGITLNWTGGEANPARVLAVYGDLTMENVNISAGMASAVFLTACYPYGMCFDQTFTLARGGGVATWGVARLTDCEISGNILKGPSSHWRDQAAYGGGIYGDVLILEDCVIGGNKVKGYGVSGGGVFSTGGWDSTQTSRIIRCAVTGNRIAGLHTYGGGVYSDGGGRGNMRKITLADSTIARNLVMHNPDLGEPAPETERYYRGGGFYMSNGMLELHGCTIAENQVMGYAATFHGEPNMSGGGVAATVGDAHVVENMQISQSIIAGNTVEGEPQDLFTGSLIDFYSWGYNLVGDLNFDYILAPVPWWSHYLSRKHWPKAGDVDGVDAADALDLDNPAIHSTILSAGVGSGERAVLWYPPAGIALDAVPASDYAVTYVWAGFDTASPFGEGEGFLNDVLDEVAYYYGDYSSDFGTQDLSAVTFYGPAETWPGEPENADWIAFWRDLDSAIAGSPWPDMGPEKLGDDFWGRPWQEGGPETVQVRTGYGSLSERDQLGNPRPAGSFGDVGAIELQ